MLQDPKFEVRALLTTLTEGYQRVSTSGVREGLLDHQAERLRLPLVKVWIPPACPNALYEERMAQALGGAALRDIQHVAFADLYLVDVRAYREQSLAAMGKAGVFPLWGRDTATLARLIIAARFRATVVCLDPRVLPHALAGREFNERFLADLPPGIDRCGERGEFHTFVSEAPMFGSPISCRTGEVVTRDNFVYCDVVPFAAAEGAAPPRRPVT